MRRRSKQPGKPWQKTAALILLGLLLINTAGCAKSYQVVNGEEKILVPKAQVDQLFTDNEALIKALEECQAKSK